MFVAEQTFIANKEFYNTTEHCRSLVNMTDILFLMIYQLWWLIAILSLTEN